MTRPADAPQSSNADEDTLTRVSDSQVSCPPSNPQDPIRAVVHEGSVKNIYFLGKKNQTNWDKTKLHNYNFMIHSTSQFFTIRASIDYNVGLIAQWAVNKWSNLKDSNLRVTFKGRILDHMDTLNMFPDHSLFILIDEAIPDIIKGHKGKVWQCLDCGYACNRKDGLPRNCPSKHSNILWFETLKANFVRIHDRYTKPYGCPDGHTGAKESTVSSESRYLPLVTSPAQKTRREESISLLSSPVPSRPYSPKPGKSKLTPGVGSPSTPHEKRRRRMPSGFYKGDQTSDMSSEDSG